MIRCLTMAAADSHDTEALKAALAASEARASAAEAQIAALTLMIEKLRRALYGRRSPSARSVFSTKLELALDELTASATEDELAAGEGGGPDHRGERVRPPQAVAQALPRAPAARTRGGACAHVLRVLRIGQAVEGRGGCDGNAGGDPAPLEGDPDGAREVHVPGLRADLAAAGALPRDTARLGGA